MPHAINAVYEHGVFVPQAPVSLPEHTIVEVFLPGDAGKMAGNRFQRLIAEPLVAAKLVVPSREERHER